MKEFLKAKLAEYENELQDAEDFGYSSDEVMLIKGFISTIKYVLGELE